MAAACLSNRPVHWLRSLVLAAALAAPTGVSGCDEGGPGARRDTTDADPPDANLPDLGNVDAETSPDRGRPDANTARMVDVGGGGRDGGIRQDQWSPDSPELDCLPFDPDVALVDAGPIHCDPHAAEGRVTLYDNPRAINAFRSCRALTDLDRAVYMGFSIPAELAEEVMATGGDRLAVRVEDFAADIDVLLRSVGGDVDAACADRPMVSAVLSSGEGGVLGWIYPRHSDERGLFAWFSLVYLDADGGALRSATGEVRAR